MTGIVAFLQLCVAGLHNRSYFSRRVSALVFLSTSKEGISRKDRSVTSS